mmetsp:Transcript_843/g.2580  ORF Transcript_843/g.2580 Transcript_843/m.2580 type:complete len:358 (+) Transcript_843:707-1780(+)
MSKSPAVGEEGLADGDREGVLRSKIVIHREDRGFQRFGPVSQVDLVGGRALRYEASPMEVKDEEGRGRLQLLRVSPADPQRAPPLDLLPLQAAEGDETGLDSEGRDVSLPAEQATLFLRRGDGDEHILGARPPHGDGPGPIDDDLPANLHVRSYHSRKPLGHRQLRQVPEGLDELDVCRAVLLRDPPSLLHRLHQEADAMVVGAGQLGEQVIAVMLLVAPAVGGGSKQDHAQEVLQAGGILVAVHVTVQHRQVDVAQFLYRRLQGDVGEEQARPSFGRGCSERARGSDQLPSLSLCVGVVEAERELEELLQDLEDLKIRLERIEQALDPRAEEHALSLRGDRSRLLPQLLQAAAHHT